MKLPIYSGLCGNHTCGSASRGAEKQNDAIPGQWDGIFGNPASRSHRFGWQARRSSNDEARQHIADLIQRPPPPPPTHGKIVFLLLVATESSQEPCD